MSVTTALVSLEEYLSSTYEPDMDFVDGVLVERNVGTQRHGLLQSLLVMFFGQFRKTNQIAVFTETRLLVDATGRHRIPDVMILNKPFTRGKVVKDVPAIIVEVKSPDDSFDDIIDRCFDYERLTVGSIMVMDPVNQRAWMFKRGNLQLIVENILLTAGGDGIDIQFSPASLFSELDEEQG